MIKKHSDESLCRPAMIKEDKRVSGEVNSRESTIYSLAAEGTTGLELDIPVGRGSDNETRERAGVHGEEEDARVITLPEPVHRS